MSQWSLGGWLCHCHRPVTWKDVLVDDNPGVHSSEKRYVENEKQRCRLCHGWIASGAWELEQHKAHCNKTQRLPCSFGGKNGPLLVAAGCHACVCVPWLGAICGCHGWGATSGWRSGERFLQGARCCGWVPQGPKHETGKHPRKVLRLNFVVSMLFLFFCPFDLAVLGEIQFDGLRRLRTLWQRHSQQGAPKTLIAAIERHREWQRGCKSLYIDSFSCCNYLNLFFKVFSMF